jgi:hypothetical protein
MSKQQLFIDLAKPSSEGISRIVFTYEFKDKFSSLATTNGGSWSRFDGNNVLTRNYNFISVKKTEVRFSNEIEEFERECIKEEIDKDENIIKQRKKTKTNKIIAYKLTGLRKEEVSSRQIRSDIKDYFKDKRCAVLYTSNIEIDHKNGRYNNPRVNNQETQKIEDFQALSKSVNTAKRQHCKECKITGNRFDAKNIGYKASVSSGNKKYIESPDGCVGCYWYDVRLFNSCVSRDIEDL